MGRHNWLLDTEDPRLQHFYVVRIVCTWTHAPTIVDLANGQHILHEAGLLSPLRMFYVTAMLLPHLMHCSYSIPQVKIVIWMFDGSMLVIMYGTSVVLVLCKTLHHWLQKAWVQSNLHYLESILLSFWEYWWNSSLPCIIWVGLCNFLWLFSQMDGSQGRSQF